MTSKYCNFFTGCTKVIGLEIATRTEAFIQLPFSIIPIAIPSEIVAIITNSLRISEEVSELVISRRTVRITPLDLVRGRSYMVGTFNYQGNVSQYIVWNGCLISYSRC